MLSILEFLSRARKSSLNIARYLMKGRCFSSPASDNFKNVLRERIEAIKQAGTWKNERVITSKQGPEINVQGSKDKMLNFCANNYLGLSVRHLVLIT